MARNRALRTRTSSNGFFWWLGVTTLPQFQSLSCTRDLVAELLHQLIARRGRQRPEFQGGAVGADGVGAHRLLGRENRHETVEVGLARMIVVGVALTLDGLADLVIR